MALDQGLRGPLWFEDPDTMDNVHPASPELGLSDDLVRGLLAWQDELDATYDLDDPASSPGFPSEAAEHDFHARGWELARRVGHELDETWEVTYAGGSPFREVEIPNPSTPS
ncbi:hypothetical protein AB0K15_29595 [Amycolatopsis sp. NPDC049253]|uniref:hypothetical protein n=1 Tax=Amycolatopsis sp. NPDC049253 TaxID=3155274 RepID=UPI00343BF30B